VRLGEGLALEFEFVLRLPLAFFLLLLQHVLSVLFALFDPLRTFLGIV
jgi:hypothetical protein